MPFVKIFVPVTAGLCAVCIIGFCIGSKKPFKYLLLNLLSGVIALAAVNLTARFSGVHIPVNPYSAGAGAVFGIPAVFGLLILRLFM